MPRSGSSSSPATAASVLDADPLFLLGFGLALVADLHLQADIELTAVLAVAWPDEMQVLDEPARRAPDHATRLLGVLGALDQRVHRGHEIGFAIGVDLADREPPDADRQDLVATVGELLGLTDRGERPDARDRQLPATHLAPIADEHDPERCLGLQAPRDHQAVALLEDVQR